MVRVFGDTLHYISAFPAKFLSNTARCAVSDCGSPSFRRTALQHIQCCDNIGVSITLLHCTNILLHPFTGVVYVLDFACVPGHTRKRRCLLPSAVPSIFFWRKSDTPTTISRRARAATRHVLPDRSMVDNDHSGLDTEICQRKEQTVHDQDMDSCDISEDIRNVYEEVVCTATDFDVRDADVSTQTESVVTSDSSSQTDSSVTVNSVPLLSITNLESDQRLLHYYTGLENVAKLMTVFHTLGPAVNHLTYFKTQTVTGITPVNQFILMLAKLRQDLDYLPLSQLCGVSEFTARNIFITWINFCARQWSEVKIWPDKDLVQFYAPNDFRHKFPTTRLVIDGTEIPIQKPSNPIAQRSTFSSYKNRNTVKVLVGSTPGGLISYLSPAYGGSTSDRQIVERSSLPEMCDANDSVMADKGFNVQDIFAARDIHVNIPTFFKKKNRMSGRQVLADRKISSKRVHIERIIGLMKTYKILNSPLPASEAKLASHIVTICAMLCNFRNRIVSKSA